MVSFPYILIYFFQCMQERMKGIVTLSRAKSGILCILMSKHHD